MKTVAGFLIVVSLIVGFTSCQKEIDWGLNTPTQGDSTFLDRIYSVDSISPTQIDTVTKAFFYYDNLKRLQRSIGYYVGVIDTLRVEYFYNGNEVLPYKIVEHDLADIGGGQGIGYYRDTVFYQYSNTGQVAKDSSLEWYVTGNQNFGITTSDYVTTGNKVVESSRQYGFNNGQYVLINSYSKAFTITLQGNNIINQIDTSMGSNMASVQLLFDGKPNPVYKVNKIHYPILRRYDDEQSNNPVDIVVTSATPTTYQVTYQYSYRNDNYPLVQWATDQTGFIFKTLYFYKTL